MDKIMTFEEYDVFNEGITIGDELTEVKRKLISAIKNIGGKQISVKNIALGLSIAGLIYIHGEEKVNMAIKSDVVSSVATKENVPLPDPEEVKVIAKKTPEVTKEITKDNSQGFYSATKLRLSEKGKDMIKKEEQLRLTAYDIKDGTITVGWGHAERKEKTKRKKGSKITLDEAERLFTKDSKNASDGVRQIFKEWEDEGVYVPITQHQFDALVSIAFNSGVGAVRRSEIMKKLKKSDYEGASKEILTHRLGRKIHQEGIKKRRKKEATVFSQGH